MSAQKTQGYISLANSSKDTLQYLINNFEKQKIKYVGKPMSVIFNDLEIAINRQLALQQNPANKKNIAGLKLRLYNADKYDKLSKLQQRDFYINNKNYEIYIETEQALLCSDYEKFIMKYGLKWSTEMKTFYSPYIVKSIRVTGYAKRL